MNQKLICGVPDFNNVEIKKVITEKKAKDKEEMNGNYYGLLEK